MLTNMEKLMLPETFRDIRESMNLTRPELADLLGFSRQSVWTWEVGKRPIPEYAVRSIRLLESMDIPKARIILDTAR